MTASIRKHMAEHTDHFDPRQYLSPARDAIQAVVAHKMRHVLGCSGKA
jgi:fructose-bisphosphate aldolase class II